nr:MAG TPA: hypothetical protein [Bacteriophage sp.]
MTTNEFSKVCKDFFAEHDDFRGVIHILNNKASDDGDPIGFSGMKGSVADILGMCLIMCDKASVSMREISVITKQLANDPNAMAALANINGDDDEDEKKDEPPKKCCGECNRKEDSKEDGKPSREEIAKMLVDVLFGD